MIRIGIDVGGTNTDAVVMQDASVLASHKSATTADVGSGVIAALDAVLEGFDPGEVSAVMIGTTHFVNAVVERKRLLATAAVRIAAPATMSLLPLTAWPADLAAAIGNHGFIVHGGINYDGSEVSPLDEGELRELGAELRRREVSSVALTSVFSPLDAEMEVRAGEILRDEIPDLDVTCSSDIGRLGLLERENAAIINASLRKQARLVMRSFQSALEQAGISAPLFISQNDGTLMSAEWAERFPVLTFASGPTNSMRGAAFLSAEKDAIVVDIGGTTTDVGALRNGFPREASAEAEIASVKTNFRMPDVISVGLGGGSRVVEADGGIEIGPDSVGYALTEQAIVFGGETLTATDIAVASGQIELGDPGRVAELVPSTVEAAIDRIHAMVEEAVDRMKTSADDLPVLLVGGGTILIDRPLAGSSRVIRPEHSAVANAIGAAIAQVGGEVDEVISLDEYSREEALERAQNMAVERAVAAGAKLDTVQVVDIDEVPLTYMPGGSMTRFRIRVVGDLVLEAEAAGDRTTAKMGDNR